MSQRNDPSKKQPAKTNPSEEEKLRQGQVEQEVAIPVVEEAMKVGKREVQTGGVRVQSQIVEKPVEETVALREEHVNVERRPIDRPITPAEGENLFREVSIEIQEMEEEAVVAKEARIVEEVIINKQTEQHTQQIRDKVRRTDVGVERLSAEDRARNLQRDVAIPPARTSGGFGAMEDRYRNDYSASYGSQYGSYEHYKPAYRYGYDLAKVDRFKGRDWDAIEPEARRSWEETNPGTWENVRQAVQHAWDYVMGGRR